MSILGDLAALITALELVLNEIKTLPVSPNITDLINKIEKVLDVLKAL